MRTGRPPTALPPYARRSDPEPPTPLVVSDNPMGYMGTNHLSLLAKIRAKISYEPGSLTTGTNLWWWYSFIFAPRDEPLSRVAFHAIIRA